MNILIKLKFFTLSRYLEVHSTFSVRYEFRQSPAAQLRSKRVFHVFRVVRVSAFPRSMWRFSSILSRRTLL